MNVVVFTGAGLSTASGIPDFRSKGGVWERFDPMEFTIERFHQDPAGFWDRRASLIAAMDYLDAQPNAAHHALAEAAQDGRVAHVITQNVDGLHGKAGTPAERLLELHGNGALTRCLRCDGRLPVQQVLAGRRDGETPRCGCGGLLKPDVVLFGEPVVRMDDAARLVMDASHLVVAGTSLRVHPAAGLVDVALGAGAEVTICNGEPTPYDHVAHVERGDVVDTLVRRLAKVAQ